MCLVDSLSLSCRDHRGGPGSFKKVGGSESKHTSGPGKQGVVQHPVTFWKERKGGSEKRVMPRSFTIKRDSTGGFSQRATSNRNTYSCIIILLLC